MVLIQSVLEQGMIYAIMALGVYITYKILDFPDLTVDGSFPMGAALTALMISKDIHPAADAPCFIFSGSICRDADGADPCEIKGEGSSVRYYYDDGALHGKPACGGQGEPADL